ncbi:Ig-like domain-containing protein [Candidatus Galacturonibacter soehngenii]|uniref:BIG2 domain-containing protein n=1 Tax=Candidatus Galacturonatibacter soehngenii TaxID=2307010 RepID=A0A7V7UAL6_9FIRM|nr:Ig-like domain-containing protein [Candidatus Galacturonibacter soehngenii]KAB1435906.1 hypothetical protein F7O84_16150 [Candidatus Galacturonibacter soehngenii]
MIRGKKTAKRKLNNIFMRFIAVLILICYLFNGMTLVQATAKQEADAEATQADIKVTEIDLGDYQTEMKVGEKQLLSITPLPSDATNQTLTFQSSDETVATINGMGRINAISEGSTTITVKCGDIENGFSLSVISGEVAVTDIEIGYYDLEMEIGKTQTLLTTVLPTSATNQTVTYSSSDTSIATILSTGEIKALAKGVVTITASAGNISKDIKLTVKEEAKVKAKQIDLGDYQDTMAIGEKQLLSATVLPTDTTEQTLSYKSSNEEVATVNELGRITAIAVGKTKITISCGEVSNSFSLTVKKTNDIEVTDIEIGNYEEEMIVDKTQTITATVMPSNATDTTITYSSSNTGIATVLSSGEVKAIAKGNVIITVKAGEITKEIPITVKVATTKIELNNNYVVLKPMEEFTLKASALPTDAVQSMTYEVVDKDIATITSNGTVQAKSIGTTSVIVSNGDLSVAATVIVNESGTADQTMIENATKQVVSSTNQTLSGVEAEVVEAIRDESNVNDIELTVKNCRVLSKNILKALYETGKTIIITGDGYTIHLKGTDIVNYENELITQINFEKKDKAIEFFINENKNLPGKFTLEIEESGFKYLYIYNEAKEKFQQLKIKDIIRFELDMHGKYMITQEKINSISISIVVIVLVVAILLGLTITYIAVKKQYWFW